VLALSATGCPGREAFGQRTAFDGERAYEHVRTQLAFGPRVPGTVGHRRAGDWIVEQMRRTADTVIVQRWTHVTARGDSLPMRNVLARFHAREGALAAGERVLYLAHWDTRPISDAADGRERDIPVPGANDGASGVALLVALGEALQRERPSVGVDLLFVDGEDYGDFGRDRDVLIGSRYFAEHLPSADYRPIFGVLWDMVGDGDLQIYQEGHSMEHAPEVVLRVWRQAEELGYGGIFVPRRRHTVTDDHLPLLRKGLRVIDVIDFDYPHHHTPRDDLSRVSARSLQVVGDVALALVTEL
jgi:hypothetical protein